MTGSCCERNSFKLLLSVRLKMTVLIQTFHNNSARICACCARTTGSSSATLAWCGFHCILLVVRHSFISTSGRRQKTRASTEIRARVVTDTVELRDDVQLWKLSGSTPIRHDDMEAINTTEWRLSIGERGPRWCIPLYLCRTQTGPFDSQNAGRYTRTARLTTKVQLHRAQLR